MRSYLFIILSFLLGVNTFAEGTKTISVTFADFKAGSFSADNEKHDLGGGLVIYTTKCHFTEQLRIYSSTSNNGYVISEPLPGAIKSIEFNMGFNKKEVLNVYGSADKNNWTLIKGVETTTKDYKDYTLNFPSEKNYTCFKLDVKGENQIRIVSMTITYISDENNEDSDEGLITVSTPIFNPGESTFSSETLNVTIQAAGGCDIYYTTNGDNPSYTSEDEYIGTKGNIVTILASNSPVTLKAIAVNPTIGECSSVSSAIYTYAMIVNDGSKNKPYTIAEIKSMTDIKTGKWVKGTIYGTMEGEDPNIVTTSNFRKASNIIIGDESAHIPVQLPYNSDIRNEINLKDHPYLKGKEIIIKGDLREYYGTQGIQEPTDYTITYDVPINSFGYSTLFIDIPVSVPTNSIAYYCTTEEDIVNLLPIGSIIPDSVGVIIEATPNSTCTLIYTVKKNVKEESIFADNQLIGFTKDSIITADGYAYYALNAKNNKLGFYIPQTAVDINDASAGFIAKAYKAYLKVPAEQNAIKFLIHRDNSETIIVNSNYVSENLIYDLQGRIVSSPQPGIYINKGKKIIIR